MQNFIEKFQPKDVCYKCFLNNHFVTKICMNYNCTPKDYYIILVAILFCSTVVVHAIVCHGILNCESLLITYFEHFIFSNMSPNHSILYCNENCNIVTKNLVHHANTQLNINQIIHDFLKFVINNNYVKISKVFFPYVIFSTFNGFFFTKYFNTNSNNNIVNAHEKINNVLRKNNTDYFIVPKINY